jgi:hypothetical protein
VLVGVATRYRGKVFRQGKYTPSAVVGGGSADL